MNDIEKDYVVEAKAPTWLTGVAIAALLVALGGLAWSMSLQSSLTDAQKNLTAANQQNTQLQAKLEDTNERLKAQGEALGQSVGLTQKQLEDKSNELIASQRATAAATRRLQNEEKDTRAQVGQVQTDVAGVKTDVTSVKTDVATTQADLADTKTQMGSMKGDLGVMSGLIATNHDQLEELKHRGDRNYYEFTLTKGAPAQNVGTIKLQLKKVDQKRSKYTMIVSSDDHNIEKKDKNIDEPVQFYSGKQPMLFELVVNNISKKQVSGYLSTPKNAPTPINVQ